MVENGPWIEPQMSWLAGGKGLFVATLTEVASIINQGRQLPSEYQASVGQHFGHPGPRYTEQPSIGACVHCPPWTKTCIVRLAPVTYGTVATDDMTTLLLQVHQDQCEEGWWQRLRDSPAKTLMKTLFPDQTVKTVAQLWWQCNLIISF